MSNGVNNLNSVCFTKMYIYLQGNKLRKRLSSNHLVLIMDIYIYYNFELINIFAYFFQNNKTEHIENIKMFLMV